MIDRIAYSPYGEATRTLRSDVNGDGFVNRSDYTGIIRPRIGAAIGTANYIVEADLDRNGVINQLDYDICIADDGKSSSGGVGEAGLFSRGVRNSVGYCGYVFNEDSGLYTVRFRTYSPTLGRWLERDPAGYVDGMGLYEYVRGGPIAAVDPWGLDDLEVGPPTKPSDFEWDEDFKFDPSFKPDILDWVYWYGWDGAASLCEGASYLGDGTRAYRRYRDASGEDLIVDYERAYREDVGIRNAVDAEIAAAICDAGRLATEGNRCEEGVSLRSRRSRGASCETENWQKALGGHRIWSSGKLRFDQSTQTWTVEIEIEMEDFYNFNRGDADIATGIPDNSNGRFEQCGWAKSFFSRGKIRREFSWREGEVPAVCASTVTPITCGSKTVPGSSERGRTRDRGRRGRDFNHRER